MIALSTQGVFTLATRDQSQRRKKLSKYKERYPTKFSLVLVLHGHVDQPISMTLSLDQTDQKEYLVRLLLFGRSN
jgi:hypothetical protein